MTPESAARSYPARGWSVIPMEARTKRPLVRWQEFQSRHASPDYISRWFRRPTSGLLPARFRVWSSWMSIVNTADSRALLEMEHGSLPATVASIIRLHRENNVGRVA